MNIVAIICFSITGFYTYMIFRNNKVYTVRVETLRKDSDTYRKLPSYKTMLWKLWKPVKSFVNEAQK